MSWRKDFIKSENLPAEYGIMVSRIPCYILIKPVKRQESVGHGLIREFYLGNDERGKGRLKKIKFYK